MEPLVVLGLSINTRMQGLAVISGNTLMDFQIHLRKESWSPRKRELILTNLQTCCTSYSITSVALSIPYEQQISQHTAELLDSITKYFRQRKITVYSYPPQALHSFCEGSKTKTKKEMMRNVAEKYPELSHCYRKEMKNKNKYYVKLFEAVGVAMIHSKRMKEGR